MHLICYTCRYPHTQNGVQSHIDVRTHCTDSMESTDNKICKELITTSEWTRERYKYGTALNCTL